MATLLPRAIKVGFQKTGTNRAYYTMGLVGLHDRLGSVAESRLRQRCTNLFIGVAVDFSPKCRMAFKEKRKSLPTGHFDKGESYRDCVIREIEAYETLHFASLNKI